MKQKSEHTRIRNEYRHRDQEMETHKKEVHPFNPSLPGGVKCTECLEVFPDNNTLYSHNLGNHMKICDILKVRCHYFKNINNGI